MLQCLLYDGGGEVVFDIYGLHQADAARAIDEVVLVAERLEFAVAVVADTGGIFEQVFFEDGLDGGATGCAGNRIAPKCSALIPCLKQVDARPGPHRPLPPTAP